MMMVYKGSNGAGKMIRMFALLSFFLLLNCNEALPHITKAHPITTPPPTNHTYDGPSKADVTLATVDHVGTIFDDIAREFNQLFANLIHISQPETPPITTPPPLKIH